MLFCKPWTGWPRISCPTATALADRAEYLLHLLWMIALRQSELELAGGAVALTADPGQTADSAGYELALPASSNSAGKVLGSRDFVRFYKQKHRPNDTRESVQANAVVARYEPQ